MAIVLAVLTYMGYIFVVLMYSLKLKKYLSLPLHLRAEVYPEIPGAPGRAEEKSIYESTDWWLKPHGPNNWARRIWFLFSDYFLLREYFARNKGYWIFLYPWHIGFITIITFHICAFFSALLSLLGVPVAYGSPSVLGNIIYLLTLVIGAISFIAGLFGSIGMLIKRLIDRELRMWATPQNYFTYVFLLAVFLSGFWSWYFFDPTFSGYTQFWKGLLTFRPVDVELATGLHIFLFAMLLFYLPFTRSLHYITRIFGFLLIRWDDKPNVQGGALEKKIEELLSLPVRWNGPHIQPGRTWREVASDTVHRNK
jgi:nitrate reductase gamma subunit